LTKLKIEFPFLNEVSCVPLQQSLRHQQRAFRNLAPEASEVPKIQEKDARGTAGNSLWRDRKT